MQDQPILITGAAGFIGFHLSKRLLEQGCRIIGYDNINHYYDTALKEARLDILRQYEGFTFIKAALEDKEALESVFTEHAPGVVINLAAQAGVRYSIDHPEEYIQSNVVGFFNVLECCRYHKPSLLLYASSSSVYGMNAKVPFSTEDRVDNPVSLYAATKKSNELMAYTYSHLYGYPAVGLRFFTVYGPYGRPDMAYFSFSRAIMEGKPVKIFNHGDLYRDFTYVDDIIDGMLAILEHPEKIGGNYKIYNIGNSRPEKLMDFIGLLEEKLGREAVKEYYPMQPGDVYQTYADTSALERDFGFCPKTPLTDGLDQFVAWFREYQG